MSDRKQAGRARIREHALIGGEPATAGESIRVTDPADGSVIGAVPKLSAAQVERAIQLAAGAFPAWAARPGPERAAMLRRWADLIDRDAEALAALLALENGKPFAEAAGEIAYANQFVRWFAGEAERLGGRAMESWSAGDRILTWKDPVGPVAAITPWNFPAAMATRKLAPAFAAGCTVVLKPASATPFTALALAELAYEAGLPPDALSVVTGDSGTVGGALTASPLIRKLSFTGSTPVGRQLMADCAPTLKRLSLELGGAAPALVFADADLERAVEGAVTGKFRNSGQSCVSMNRLYVERAVLGRFVEAAAAKVAALKVGAAFDDDVEIGPLIDENGLRKVQAHVTSLRASGARVVVGGERHARGGLFFQPTLLVGGDDTLLREEETFGPVLAVFPFDDEAEAVRRANATSFGLASYVFTGGLDRAFRLARGIEAGMVGVNTGLISNAANPFGGIRQSGFGREGSIYGLDEYLQIKAVTLAGAG